MVTSYLSNKDRRESRSNSSSVGSTILTEIEWMVLVKASSRLYMSSFDSLN